MPTMATANAVFKWGHRQVKLLTVDDNSPSPPPFPLLVATPLEGTGIFPVILFVHGYLLHNTFYSELFQHIASHGYIVVSPQVVNSFQFSILNFNFTSWLLCRSLGTVRSFIPLPDPTQTPTVNPRARSLNGCRHPLLCRLFYLPAWEEI